MTHEFEERAAIMEHHGGIERKEAERLAREDALREMRERREKRDERKDR